MFVAAFDIRIMLGTLQSFACKRLRPRLHPLLSDLVHVCALQQV
jgi:hypothetical protein